MFLKALKFCRFKGEKIEWSIEGRPIDKVYNQWLELENINLIVGRNASGKSRTIEVIRQIADLISGDERLSRINVLGFGTAEFNLLFDDNGIEIEYYLNFKNGKITQEYLKLDNIERLNRKKQKLYYDEIGKSLSFKTDDDVLALSRRDSKQQPFFENLYSWGKNLNHYRFGGYLGRDALLKDINSSSEDEEINFKDGNEVAEVLIKGKKKFGIKFIKTIINDMNSISYNINTIDTVKLKHFPVSAFGLGIKEDGMDEYIEQPQMSQGMFRAISLLIQINYSLLSEIPSCILIDDIGEGLDYDRSKSLIDLIINKIEKSNIQVIMTTNDRFVMNKIPLKYWSVIQRIPKKSLFYNYKNSKETFEDFEYTGLNNFDFLQTEFYINGLED